jgi:hypothetical protein
VEHLFNAKNGASLSLSLSLSRDDTLEGQMVLQSVMLIIHPNLNKEMIKESYN